MQSPFRDLPGRPLVLVAEDDPGIRDMLSIILESSGFEVVAVEDGPTALAAGEQHEPDVALLDVMMPGIDGIAVARTLRDRRPELPIILVSARTEDTDVWEGWASGIDSYVTKPFDVDALVAEIDRVLEARRNAA